MATENEILAIELATIPRSNNINLNSIIKTLKNALNACNIFEKEIQKIEFLMIKRMFYKHYIVYVRQNLILQNRKVSTSQINKILTSALPLIVEDLRKANFEIDEKYLNKLSEQAKQEILDENQTLGLNKVQDPFIECQKIMADISNALETLLGQTLPIVVVFAKKLLQSKEICRLLNKKNIALVPDLHAYYQHIISGDSSKLKPFFSHALLNWNAEQDKKGFSKGYTIFLYHLFIVDFLTAYNFDPVIVCFFENILNNDFESLYNQEKLILQQSIKCASLETKTSHEITNRSITQLTLSIEPLGVIEKSCEFEKSKLKEPLDEKEPTMVVWHYGNNTPNTPQEFLNLPATSVRTKSSQQVI